jgi:hypothetical protein
MMTRGTFLRLLALQTAPRRKQAKAMNTPNPLEIRLLVTSGPALRVSLANLSAAPLMVLHDRNLQPSQPVLESLVGHQAGEEVRFTDQRRIEKFDRTPYRALYHRLDAGREILLGEQKFQHADDGQSYYFQWGPFEALGIAAGIYTASIRWTSVLANWVDSETHQTGKWKDIWLGELTSARVKVELPKRS